jgi:4-alpha-glucanotransferase/alpha-amylase
VLKTLSLHDNRMTVRYALRAQAAGRFETELNLAMPSCDGVLGRYVFEGGIPGGFGQSLSLPSMTTLSLEDGVLGGMVELLCSPPAALDAGPHHTVSQSEDGFEKIMQAVTLRLAWQVEAGDSDITVALEIRRA